MFKLLAKAATGIAKFFGRTATNPVVVGTATVAGGTILTANAIGENIIDPLQQPLIDTKKGISQLSFALIFAAVAVGSFIAFKALK